MENKSEIKRVVATAREIYTDFNYKQLTSGHINQTYLIDNNGEQLILQRLNPKVFTNLQGISKNIVNRLLLIMELIYLKNIGGFLSL